MAERLTVSKIAAWPLRALVLVYRYGISSVLPGTCRFQPTCSAYAAEALETHGAVRGSFLTVRRICRCHPFGDAGYDPVPPAKGAPAHGKERPQDIAEGSQEGSLRSS